MGRCDFLLKWYLNRVKELNAEISVTRKNVTSSEPALVLSPFLGSEIITLSKGFVVQCTFLDLYEK